mmetsp:Transcript_10791/g.18897  ORF Transcript_10791/g.18897 Transcript_10791/m.18897 type:complete len:145 (-) Transcript_10791:106-540(-)
MSQSAFTVGSSFAASSRAPFLVGSKNSTFFCPLNSQEQRQSVPVVFEIQATSASPNLAPEIKLQTIQSFQRSPSDTGSAEVQVALLSSRITYMTEHLKAHPKDFASRRGLYKMVASRKSQLRFLKNVDFDSYATLLKKLSLKPV